MFVCIYRSPNGAGLVHWPQYGAERDYLSIGMEQEAGQHPRKDSYTFMTETLPEKIRQHREKMETSEQYDPVLIPIQ